MDKSVKEANVEAYYIKEIEKFKWDINKAETSTEIARLGILCIYALTKDKTFREYNLRKLKNEKGNETNEESVQITG